MNEKERSMLRKLDIKLQVEYDLIKNPTHEDAFRLADKYHKIAVKKGIINDENILEGQETEIRIAKIINSLK